MTIVHNEGISLQDHIYFNMTYKDDELRETYDMEYVYIIHLCQSYIINLITI